MKKNYESHNLFIKIREGVKEKRQQLHLTGFMY